MKSENGCFLVSPSFQVFYIIYSHPQTKMLAATTPPERQNAATLMSEDSVKSAVLCFYCLYPLSHRVNVLKTNAGQQCLF